MTPGPTSVPELPARAARAIAFYLPQFYPTPENDRWWGPGFTEWTNVATADPQFPGHAQPQLPADLGFYDLRVPEVRKQQAQLAAAHGIEAFCYWHFWSEGTRLLDRPFAEVLASGQPDFPFCLAWANESWARRWHGTGGGSEVLMAQTYSEADDVAHARWLATAFADPRYVRVDGRPLLLIYRPYSLRAELHTVQTLRAVVTASGLPEPYLVGINAFNPTADTRDLGFDATLDFEPQLGALDGVGRSGLKTYDYADSVRRMRATPRVHPSHPTVFVSWDNTARRGREAIVMTGSDPAAFERSLAQVLHAVRDQPMEQRLVFLNAWNEWAEGNHLEPDLRHGLGWLEAVRRQLVRSPG
jgi:O-antigen biosynthesis protein